MLEEFANLPGHALANTIDAAGVAVQPEMVVSAVKQLASDPTPLIEGAKDFAKEVAGRPIAVAEQLSISDLVAPSAASVLTPALKKNILKTLSNPKITSMGFKDPNKFGTLEEPTPFGEQDYPYTQSVVVEFPDGDTFVDAVKGLNSGHALERAKINWDGAKIRKATRFEELMQERLDRSKNR